MSVLKTPLYNEHVKAGAKMVDFAGYMMPVNYAGIVQEHKKVRESVGLFDVSHMGEFRISGPDALKFLQKVTINNVEKLAVGQAQYSAMCYENGGIVDDLIVYKNQNDYLLIVNAGNLQKDWDWLNSRKSGDLELKNESDATALLALQGRNAEATLKKLTNAALREIKFYWFAFDEVAGIPAMISKTGYTGEAGFEIAVANEHAVELWRAILEAGQEFGIEPIGLGARDTLRMEMKYCLYGNDIDATTNPIEAGLGWITKLEKGAFIGSEVIAKVKDQGPKRKLVGLLLEGRQIARHGHYVFHNNSNVGVVTSGTKSISLDQPIAIAYVAVEYAAIDSELEIEIRDKRVSARVVKTPFYHRPY